MYTVHATWTDIFRGSVVVNWYMTHFLDYSSVKVGMSRPTRVLQLILGSIMISGPMQRLR
jgi:hypothetical protein